MESINIIDMFLISLPEAVLSLYVSFLFIFEGRNLPLKDDKSNRKRNILKLLLTVFLMVTSTALIRFLISNLSIILFVEFLTTTCFFKFIYKLSWVKSAIAVFLFIFILVTMESAYMTPCINCYFNSLQAFFNSSVMIRFCLSLPSRIMQVFLIMSAWNLKLAVENFGAFKVSKFVLLVFLSSVLFAELTLFVIYLSTFNLMSVPIRVIGCIACMALGIVNSSGLMVYLSIAKSAKKRNMERSVLP